MNISAKHMASNVFAGNMLTGQESVFGKAKFTKSGIEKSNQDSLVRSFQQENSPKNKRVQQIYSKFLGGKELTTEELDYLSKNAPDLYNEVREIMQERAAMELQMKLAKTKLEVAAVCMNTLTQIKTTMGTGAMAKSQAFKTMARTNQMASAHVKFVASSEYQAKEDEKSQAEERKEQIRTLEEDYEQSREQLSETLEQSNLTEEEIVAEIGNSEEVDIYREIGNATQENVSGELGSSTEKGIFMEDHNNIVTKLIDIKLRSSVVLAKEIEEEIRERERERKKSCRNRKSIKIRLPVLDPTLEVNTFRSRIRALYSQPHFSTTTQASTTQNKVDISL